MEIKKFDKEFVERTKRIIEATPQDYNYEVTLLLNCLNGLISLPTERTKNRNPSFKESCVKKLKQMGVISRETNDDKTFRALKNAVSHMYIEPVNQDQKICGVIFKDKLKGAEEFHTELSFSVAELREYALFVANQHLQRYKD